MRAAGAIALVRASNKLRELRHAERVSGRTFVTGRDIREVEVAVAAFTGRPLRRDGGQRR